MPRWLKEKFVLLPTPRMPSTRRAVGMAMMVIGACILGLGVPDAGALERPGVTPGSAPSTQVQIRAKNNQTAERHGSRRILRVGSGMPFRLPSQAAKAARDGDIVEIAAGNYVDCAVWRANNLTIRGVGGRAHVKDKTCAGKAIWITAGDDITIENIEFSGMRVRDHNGAGIRHEGRGLTIRNSYFHDGEEGILGGGQRPGDHILIEYSEFARLGYGGQAHPIYIGRAASFTLRYSFVHDCVGEGNCVKSRALETEITCNRIASLEGNSSWEIDLPEGGFAMVRRNVIEQGRRSVNTNIIGFAMETSAKRAHPNQVLVLTDNILINDLGRGQFVLVKRRPNTSVLIKRNIFVGRGRRPDDQENTFYKSRRLAGLPPYPELPKPCQ